MERKGGTSLVLYSEVMHLALFATLHLSLTSTCSVRAAPFRQFHSVCADGRAQGQPKRLCSRYFEGAKSNAECSKFVLFSAFSFAEVLQAEVWQQRAASDVICEKTVIRHKISTNADRGLFL